MEIMTIEEVREKAKKEKAIFFVTEDKYIQRDGKSFLGFFTCSAWKDGSILTAKFYANDGRVFNKVNEFDVVPEQEIPTAIKNTKVVII